MFESAASKLEDARTALQQLESANDAPTFRAMFNAFLSHARAISYALQKGGAHVAGFAQWYAPKQKEMNADELLRFIHDSRIDDFHKGKHQLQFGTYVDFFSTGAAGPPPASGAHLVIGAEGPFWVVDMGTPRERRIPIKRGGQFTTSVGITNAPRRHRGAAIEHPDPRTVCVLALSYYEGLVHEARMRFAENSESPVTPLG